MGSWRLVERAWWRVELMLAAIVVTHLDLEAVGSVVKDVGVRHEVVQQEREVVAVKGR